MTHLLRLTLTNFRNYERLVWLPKAQKTVVFGPNGSGKTNLLEALSLLVPGRGLRKSRIEDVIKKGSTSGWGITGTFSHSLFDEIDISTGSYLSSTKRQFRINQSLVKNQHEVSEYLSAIWLTPQMDRLFSDGSSARRRFLDRLIISTEFYHAKEVIAYEKSMTQRNKLLAIQNFDTNWLSAIEESMARHAVAIAATRMHFIASLNQTEVIDGIFPEAYLEINCPISKFLQEKPALIVEDYLRQEWKKNRHIDAQKLSTTIGIHKSDIIFIEKATKLPAQLASTGQQKALLINIILKLTTYIQKQNATLPLLLLDEPLVHLDQHHRATLLSTLMQLDGFVILTGTDKDLFNQCQNTADFLHINHGKII